MLSQSPPIAEKIAKILADTKLSRASKIDKVAVLIGGKPAGMGSAYHFCSFAIML